jgi:hypothetical protein
MEVSRTTSYWSGVMCSPLSQIGVDGVVRPVAARIVEIEPARESHRHGLTAEFLRKQFRHRLHRFEIAGAAMQEEDTDLLAVRATRDLRRVDRLVDGDAHIPVEPERVDAENVFGLAQRQTGLGEDRLGARQNVFARDALRRLPSAEFWCDVHA